MSIYQLLVRLVVCRLHATKYFKVSKLGKLGNGRAVNPAFYRFGKMTGGLSICECGLQTHVNDYFWSQPCGNMNAMSIYPGA